MRWKRDFHVGYSRERVNPGDKEHTVSRIIKVVSGNDDQTLVKGADLYASIITASPIGYSRQRADTITDGMREIRAMSARSTIVAEFERLAAERERKLAVCPTT